MVLTCTIGYGLADNDNKRHILFFCPGLILKTISKTLGNFIENAIIQIFIKTSFPVKFKSFSVFLIRCVMQVTCKLKSAEKVNSKTFYAPKLHFAFFLKKQKNTTLQPLQMLQNIPYEDAKVFSYTY